MKIQLPRFYQNSKGQTIQAGYYDIGDTRLHGLGGYLLDTGHAIALDDLMTPNEEVAQIEPESQTVEFTAQAQTFIDDYGLDVDALSEYFASIGKFKVGVSDVREVAIDE